MDYIKQSLAFLTNIEPEKFDPRDIKALATQNHPLATKFIELLWELSRTNDHNSATLNEVASAIVAMTHSLQEVTDKIARVHDVYMGASHIAQHAKVELVNLTLKLNKVTT